MIFHAINHGVFCMASAAVLKLAGAKDQRAKIFELVGDLNQIEIFDDLVLLAAYIEPEKIGSIITTNKRKDESIYQGTVGLLLKKGPTAFQYRGQYKWEGRVPEVGEWLLHRASDAWRTQVNAQGRPDHGVECRLISSSLIKGAVAEPTYVY